MERSATVEKLIDLIGRGRCSIATAAGVSHSLVEDGVCHEAIQTFSSLGASGAFPGNYERDLRTWLKNLFNFSLETYSVPMRLQAHWILISGILFVRQFWGFYPARSLKQIPWMKFGMGLWAFATIKTGKQSNRP